VPREQMKMGNENYILFAFAAARSLAFFLWSLPTMPSEKKTTANS